MDTTLKPSTVVNEGTLAGVGVDRNVSLHLEGPQQTPSPEGVSTFRPLVVKLISQKRNAKQAGRDLSPAIERAKSIMDERSSALDTAWFNTQAKKYDLLDKSVAETLRRIGAEVKARKNAP